MKRPAGFFCGLMRADARQILRSTALFLVLGAALATAATDYPDNETLARQLKELAANHPEIVRVQPAAESLEKNPVWLVELGAGDDANRQTRPAMLVVAGVEGNDLAGSACALAWAGQLTEGYAKDDATRRLLDSTTLYIFPRLNSDAAQSFFGTPKVELATTRRPADDDKDGQVDEDGPEDLDGDGVIAWMRVEDPEGDYFPDPKDTRLLAKADRGKGENGGWRLLSEGIDNDKDEAWNEDGPGGVNLNRNFPFQYRYFAPGSGRFPVSEIETLMLAEFVVAHPNIGLAFTFGGADNLVQTPKSGPPAAARAGEDDEQGDARGRARGRQPVTSIQEKDLPYFRELGKAWRDRLGLKKELTGTTEPGTFSDWMYFHRGRLSLAARAWSPALQVELAKAPGKEQQETNQTSAASEVPSDKPESEPPLTKKGARKGTTASKPSEDGSPSAKPSSSEEERAFVKWLDTNAPQSFVVWKPFEHPDFPGKKVEIGGFAAFARNTPPAGQLDALVEKETKFLTDAAGKLPRIAVAKAEAKHLGNSVFELKVQVQNAGYLPTLLAHGQTTGEIAPTRVEFEAESKDFLAGSRRMLLPVIPGSGGIEEVRCVLLARGRGEVEFRVISTLGGTVNGKIELKEAK